jgi:hypothetical protein
MRPHAPVEEQDRLIDAALAATIDDGAVLEDTELEGLSFQRACPILVPTCVCSYCR